MKNHNEGYFMPSSNIANLAKKIKNLNRNPVVEICFEKNPFASVAKKIRAQFPFSQLDQVPILEVVKDYKAQNTALKLGNFNHSLSMGLAGIDFPQVRSYADTDYQASSRNNQNT